MPPSSRGRVAAGRPSRAGDLQGPISRGLAVAVAASALIGLAVQFAATARLAGSPGATVWILLRYFTVISNLLVAIVFAGLAAGARSFARPTLRGGLLVTMLLVAIVYQAVLAGTLVQSGEEKLADLFLHRITPALVLADWICCAPKGGLRWRDPPLWAVLPIVYLIYALARGAAEGRYPYPFLDVGRFGGAVVAWNALVIAIGFLAAGVALVWLDRRLGALNRAG